jgi:hypothetical protein
VRAFSPTGPHECMGAVVPRRREGSAGHVAADSANLAPSLLVESRCGFRARTRQMAPRQQLMVRYSGTE